MRSKRADDLFRLWLYQEAGFAIPEWEKPIVRRMTKAERMYLWHRTRPGTSMVDVLKMIAAGESVPVYDSEKSF